MGQQEQQPFDPERIKTPETEAEKQDFIRKVKESGGESVIVALIEGEPFISAASLKKAIGMSYMLGLAQNLEGGELSTYMMTSLKNLIITMEKQLGAMCDECPKKDGCDQKNCPSAGKEEK